MKRQTPFLRPTALSLSFFFVALGAALWLACGPASGPSKRGTEDEAAESPSSAGAGPSDGGLAACVGIPLTVDGVLDVELPDVVEIRGAVTLNGVPLPSSSVGRGSLVFRRTSGHTEPVLVALDGLSDGRYRVSLPVGDFDLYYLPVSGACTMARPVMPCVGGRLKSKLSLRRAGVLDVDIPAVHIEGQVTHNHAAISALDSPDSELSFRRIGEGELAQDGVVWLNRESGARHEALVLPGHYDIVWKGSRLDCPETQLLPCQDVFLERGRQVTADGVVDSDLQSVHMTGRVTMSGADLPNVDSRGVLMFTDLHEGARTVTVTANGPATYQVTLAPGDYRVSFQDPLRRCASPSSPGLPCSGEVQRASLTSSGVLDLDMSVVTLQGKVTLNGTSWNRYPGQLEFRREHATTSVSLENTPEGRFTVHLLQGTYDVGWRPAEDGCKAPFAVPCDSGTLRSSVLLKSDGDLDIDVPSVRIRGVLTLNGGALPGTLGPAGLRFEANGSAWAVVSPQHQYEVALLGGSYAVHYAPPSDCGAELPCSSGRLRELTPLPEEGVLDLDIPAVTIRGKVTSGGTELPSALQPRGFLSFGDGTGSTPTKQDLGTTGPTQYEARLLAGRYAVFYNPGPLGCAVSETGLPCVGLSVLGCAE